MMSKWIIKAVVQKSISYLPYSQRINYFFQKHVTGGVRLNDEHFGLKLQHAREHHHYLLTFGGENADRTILELGTGWYPVIPLLFFLTGLRKDHLRGYSKMDDQRNPADHPPEIQGVERTRTAG